MKSPFSSYIYDLWVKDRSVLSHGFSKAESVSRGASAGYKVLKNYALKIGNSKLFEKSREINEITSEIRVTGSAVQKQITDFFSTKV